MQEWSQCTAPKIDGSRNLDELLPQDLDFFILMSSLVGIAGATGQSNYAAGSSFQDQLARNRVLRGEKAVSLDLGMFVDEGVVSEDANMARTMESFGHYQPMRTTHLEALLDRYCDPNLPLLSPNTCQVVCGIRAPASIRAKGMQEPRWLAQPLFEALQSLPESFRVPVIHSENELQELLRAADSLDVATGIITDALIAKLASSLGVATTEIDASRPMHMYGVDSLAATELRNWFTNKLRTDVALLHILSDVSVQTLSGIAARSSQYTLALRTRT